MKELPARRSVVRAEHIALVTAAGYFVLAASWIWFSDRAAAALAPSRDALVSIELAKGGLFVLLTSVALYAWLTYSRRVAEDGVAQLNAQLERRIAERTQELVVANRALESFTYSIAHDLRAPVAHIDGFAKALEETIRKRDPERAWHFTQRIVANTRIMSEMIEGLLHVSRAERAAVERERVEMTALVQDVVDELAPDANVAIAIEALPGAHADRALLRQVWCNLISNAVKYSAKADSPRVRVSGREGLDETVYTVQDNGVGFDPAEGERLFNAFQRLSNARDYMGSGVGLAIVKRVVERHGGRVWATAEPGNGAQFCFSLPA
jgi:light-regulated signal transduction histidine kinase (bacteriophytochrome)